jgi:hypothetical protein
MRAGICFEGGSWDGKWGFGAGTLNRSTVRDPSMYAVRTHLKGEHERYR